MTRTSNCKHMKYQKVSTYCTKFNGGLTKPPLKLGMGEYNYIPVNCIDSSTCQCPAISQYLWVKGAQLFVVIVPIVGGLTIALH